MKKLFFLLLIGWLLCASCQTLTAGAQASAAQTNKETVKVKCPGKAPVLLETVKPDTFREYQAHPLQAQPAVVAVNSPVAGTFAAVMVGEGSRVLFGQELLAVETLSADEWKKLEADAAARKKIWDARRNWKEKSERAIQAAEKSYREALALMEQKRASSRNVVVSPASGSVRFVQNLGSTVDAGAVLLEIVNPGSMVFTLEARELATGAFAVGQKLDGSAEGFQGPAEVIAVQDGRITFVVDNAAGRLQEGAAISVRTLKAEHAEAITAPSTAILRDGLGDFVYVAEKNKARKIYVTCGASEAGRTMTTAGLAAGQALIVSGFDCLAEGKKLRVVNEEEIAKAQAAAAAAVQRSEGALAVKAEAAAAKKARIDQEKKAKADAAAEKKLKEAEAKARKAEAEAARKARSEQEKKAKAEAAGVKAPEKKEAATPAKATCPKKALVQTELTQAKTFQEYGYYSAPLEPEAIAIVSGKSGWVYSLKVGEDAPVQKGQELLTLIAGENEEIARLRKETARRLDVLRTRQEAKPRSERAVSAAERDYQASLARLREKTAPFTFFVTAPVAGKVRNVQAAEGADVAETAVLLEIVTEQQLIATVAVAESDGVRFAMNESVAAKVGGLVADFSAEVIAIGDGKATLRVGNDERRIQAGALLSVRKLKAEHAGAIAVASAAILQDNLGDYVYVAGKKGRAKKTYVTRGAEEAGRTLVAAGLATGQALIVSGFDCLADGKKLQFIGEEETAVAPGLPGIDAFVAYLEANKAVLQYERYERATVQKQPALLIYSGLETQKKLIDLIPDYAVDKINFELRDNRVLSTIIFAVAPKTVARREEPVAAAGADLSRGRLRLAVHGTYYMMLSTNFKEAYTALNGFGGSLAYRFFPKIDLWLSGGLAAKKNHPEWSPTELEFSMIPLSAAVRYFLMEKGKLSVFAGAGANVFLMKDVNPIEDIKETLIGFHAMAGGYYQLSRNIFAQLFAKFNLVQKDLYPDSDLDDPLNLNGLELNLGVGIRF